MKVSAVGMLSVLLYSPISSVYGTGDSIFDVSNALNSPLNHVVSLKSMLDLLPSLFTNFEHLVPRINVEKKDNNCIVSVDATGMLQDAVRDSMEVLKSSDGKVTINVKKVTNGLEMQSSSSLLLPSECDINSDDAVSTVDDTKKTVNLRMPLKSSLDYSSEKKEHTKQRLPVEGSRVHPEKLKQELFEEAPLDHSNNAIHKGEQPKELQKGKHQAGGKFLEKYAPENDHAQWTPVKIVPFEEF